MNLKLAILSSTLFYALFPLTTFIVLAGCTVCCTIGYCTYLGLRLRGAVSASKLPAALLSDSENAVLSATIKTATFKHNWHFVSTESHGPCELHSLIAWKGVPDGKPVLVVIHGTAGSSVGFSPLLDQLTDVFVVHCLDLPGFGKSPAPRSWQVVPNEEIAQLYCSCLSSYITGQQMGKVCLLASLRSLERVLSVCMLQVSLIAHSFGGYIAAKFIDKHPEMASSLILVRSAFLQTTVLFRKHFVV